MRSLVLAALLILVPIPASVVAANDTVESVTVAGSPFAPDIAPLATRATVNVTLTRRARLTVSIRRLDGSRLKLLASNVRREAGTHSWSWDGRNAKGKLARDGAYVVRVVAQNSLGRSRTERPLRKGLPSIFPANPGAIVVVVDPGHGGRYPGAVNGAYLEKDFNLDISLKLQALLEHAGVQVVMTRATDRAIDEPPTDHNGDGEFNRYDDDLLRNDIKNLARADVAVHVHNNAAPDTAARGTEVYANADQPWTPQATDLAHLMLPEVVRALEAHRSPAFDPRNAGVHFGWYYYLAPYDPAATPPIIRSSLVTSVLSESLFVTNASELEALKDPEVRRSIAAGIYVGLANWLNSRPLGIGYEPVSAPASATAGSALTYGIRVTNRGNAPSDGWTLRLGSVPAVPVYDGSGAEGTQVGSVAVPDGLQPGESVVVDVPAAAPPNTGEWLIKADIVLDDGTYASDAGIVALQMPLTTTP